MPAVWVQRTEHMLTLTQAGMHPDHLISVGHSRHSLSFSLAHPPIHLFSVSPSRVSLSQAEASKSSPHLIGLSLPPVAMVICRRGCP